MTEARGEERGREALSYSLALMIEEVARLGLRLSKGRQVRKIGLWQRSFLSAVEVREQESSPPSQPARVSAADEL